MKKNGLILVLSTVILAISSCNKNDVESPDDPPIDGPVGEAVDLGLSVLWASKNIGAESITDYGDYYAWGETDTKSDYSWSTYKWCKGSAKTLTKYCTFSYYGTVDNKTVLESSDDVAQVKWGGRWRTPTAESWKELYYNCNWVWTTISGVNGYKITSRRPGYTDKWIFLPAAGKRSGTRLVSVGKSGDYWTSSLYESGTYCAYFCWYFSNRISPRYNYFGERYHGCTIRPICY